jgi:subtilisin family serine protease
MRRLSAALTLLFSTVMTLAVPTTVQASSSAPEPEMIARAIGTQTTGPSGFMSPNDVMPWGLDRIDSRTGRDNSFTYTTDGTGVKAYIVDSGVNAAHTAEFQSRVLPGWSYRSRTSDPTGAALASYNRALSDYNTNPANGIAPCAYDSRVHQFVPSTVDGTREDGDVGRVDNDGHGTHVAGVIGGLSTGVAKGVTIVPVRVLDSCGAGTTTMVLSGLNWILADHQAGEKAVVNMSIGFESTATSIDTAIKSLLAEGIVVVAASGNDGGSACGITPAGTQGTISVGASMSNDGEPSFSNFGECVDIFAPGQSIVSAWPKYLSSTNTYVGETGTSMAAPHVTGAVARFLQSATVTATTPTDAWNWLKTNATCNAITYYKSSITDTSRTALVKTPNRLLAVEAPATVPCAPSIVTAKVANKSSVVTWEEVPAANGSAITAYTATATPGGRSCSVPSGTTCTITGLVNNTAYSFAVTATNGIGAGAASTAISGTPTGPPSPVTSLVAATQKNALDVSWVQADGDGAGITYTATASPGGGTCTSTETAMTSCTITGLINGTQYTVSVVGTNTFGTGTEATATGLADGTPEVPVTSMSVVGSKSVTVAWPAVTSSIGVTYVVTSTPGNLTCTTTETSCVVSGLKNGVNYTFAITTKTATGQVATAALQLTARPGFTVKKSTVKKNSNTTLTWLISSVSTGKKTWSESGPCSIVGTKLKAPKASTSCVVTLKVAKKGKYPAMSTRLRVTVK